eukprot:1605863-Amphidinium_carterae.1
MPIESEHHHTRNLSREGGIVVFAQQLNESSTCAVLQSIRNGLVCASCRAGCACFSHVFGDLWCFSMVVLRTAEKHNDEWRALALPLLAPSLTEREQGMREMGSYYNHKALKGLEQGLSNNANDEEVQSDCVAQVTKYLSGISLGPTCNSLIRLEAMCSN